MSESRPDPYVEAVERAREFVGDGVTVGTVTVSYDGPCWEYGQVWVKGLCGVCEATSVMRTGHSISIGYLAYVIMRYSCPQNGHEQLSEGRR